MHLDFPNKNPILAGFTLVELLVVVATIAVLAGMLLPGLGKTKTSTQAIVCMNNQQQLVHGWQLYATEYNGTLVRTAGLDSLVTSVRADKNYPLNQWCMGTADSLPSMTNGLQVMDSLLYRYVDALSAYKCPADRHTTKDPFGLKGGLPVIRSMSMNCWMNPINAWAADRSTGPVAIQITNFRKGSDILRPSSTWVTIDENPASINDGWLICDPQSSFWIDIPATYHVNGSSISFADGHVEGKRWRDPAIIARGANTGATPKDGKVDLRWLSARSTYGPNGPP